MKQMGLLHRMSVPELQAEDLGYLRYFREDFREHALTDSFLMLAKKIKNVLLPFGILNNKGGPDLEYPAYHPKKHSVHGAASGGAADPRGYCIPCRFFAISLPPLVSEGGRYEHSGLP